LKTSPLTCGTKITAATAATTAIATAASIILPFLPEAALSSSAMASHFARSNSSVLPRRALSTPPEARFFGSSGTAFSSGAGISIFCGFSSRAGNCGSATGFT